MLQRYAKDKFGRTWKQIYDPKNYWMLTEEFRVGQQVPDPVWTSKLEAIYGPIEFYMLKE